MTKPPERHHIRIQIAEGITVLTRVWLDDKELVGLVTRVQFDSGATTDGMTHVALHLLADVHLEGDLPVAEPRYGLEFVPDVKQLAQLADLIDKELAERLRALP